MNFRVQLYKFLGSQREFVFFLKLGTILGFKFFLSVEKLLGEHREKFNETAATGTGAPDL